VEEKEDGYNMIKTFRGLLADDGQDRIRLSTIKGKVGYKIINFQLLPNAPGTVDYESVVQIFKTQQTAITNTINFTDSDLLAAGYIEGRQTPETSDQRMVIFDNEIVNQDIYITHSDADVGQSCNYYLELEVIPLDDAGAEYTTLKDMRTG